MCYTSAKHYGDRLVALLQDGTLDEEWVRSNLADPWYEEGWKPEVRAIVQAAGFLKDPEVPEVKVEYHEAHSPEPVHAA